MSVVLVVLNRPEDHRVMYPSLVRGGFSVIEVDSCDVAGKAVECLPTAILASTDLEDNSCESLCQLLRAETKLAGVPLLLLADADDDPTMLACLKIGADDYVVRGCVEEIVLRRLKRLIRDRQLALSAVINEQLAQVGRLLTGIVHEIRSPLTVIRGQLELLSLALGDDEDFARYLDPIHRNVQLMQLRLDHLMAAVRGGALSLELVDINELVSEATDLFLKGADPRREVVVVATELAEILPPVPLDPGRIIQVLMNLLANAREALLAAGQGGLIRVSTNLEQDLDQTWVVVQVHDDGPGIPEHQIDRVFEPFFTTKADGSGYGLYLSSEILREHGGRLTVCRSELGGAGFAFRLPVSKIPGDDASHECASP